MGTARPGVIPGKRPSVSIIGAGRVGTALGIALRKAGYEIDLVVARHGRSAKLAARSISKSTVGLSSPDFRRLATHELSVSLIIIATPDDAIESVARELAANLRANRKSPSSSGAIRVVLHTSGALSSAVLRPLKKEGFAVGSLHPLVSISSSKAGAKTLTRAFFSIEGDATAIRQGKKLVRDLGAQSFTIKSELKPLYHAAALMASPNVTALFDIAVEMLARCGLTRLRARQILLPLVRSTLDNLMTNDPARALTGTFNRGDLATVRKHIAAIQTQNLSEALQAYVLLGRRSLSLARHPKNKTAIQRLLNDASIKRRRRS